MTTLYTYLVIVHAVAAFSGLELERTWLEVRGPFRTVEDCHAQRAAENEDTRYSQCMPLYQAEGLARPYNQGAFVLQHNQERS